MSVDHSVVQELIDSGQLDADAAARDSRRNVITRAIGAGSDGEPDYWLIPAEAGDRILVCSDGLPSELDRDAIHAILARRDRPAGARRRGSCTRRCCRGGRDNITALVVDAIAVRSRAAASGDHDTTPAAVDVDEIDGDTRPRVARRRRFLMSVRYSPGRHPRRRHPARIRRARRRHPARARRAHPRARRRRPRPRRCHRGAHRGATAPRSRPSRPSPSRSPRGSPCASPCAATSRSSVETATSRRARSRGDGRDDVERARDPRRSSTRSPLDRRRRRAPAELPRGRRRWCSPRVDSSRDAASPAGERRCEPASTEPPRGEADPQSRTRAAPALHRPTRRSRAPQPEPRRLEPSAEPAVASPALRRPARARGGVRRRCWGEPPCVRDGAGRRRSSAPIRRDDGPGDRPRR